MLNAFLDLYEEEKGRLKVMISTAVPLTKEEANRLGAGLSEKIHKEVVLVSETDPDLLGGAVVRYDDYVIDGSLRARIRQLREELLAPSEQRGS